ncbi:MAG: ankyrin repeat domain-containing protein, partial [Candidatus Hydrogenedentota bacterium]
DSNGPTSVEAEDSRDPFPSIPDVAEDHAVEHETKDAEDDMHDSLEPSTSIPDIDQAESVTDGDEKSSPNNEDKDEVETVQTPAFGFEVPEESPASAISSSIDHTPSLNEPEASNDHEIDDVFSQRYQSGSKDELPDPDTTDEESTSDAVIEETPIPSQPTPEDADDTLNPLSSFGAGFDTTDKNVLSTPGIDLENAESEIDEPVGDFEDTLASLTAALDKSPDSDTAQEAPDIAETDSTPLADDDHYEGVFSSTDTPEFDRIDDLIDQLKTIKPDTDDALFDIDSTVEEEESDASAPDELIVDIVVDQVTGTDVPDIPETVFDSTDVDENATTFDADLDADFTETSLEIDSDPETDDSNSPVQDKDTHTDAPQTPETVFDPPDIDDISTNVDTEPLSGFAEGDFEIESDPEADESSTSLPDEDTEAEAPEVQETVFDQPDIDDNSTTVDAEPIAAFTEGDFELESVSQENNANTLILNDDTLDFATDDDADTNVDSDPVLNVPSEEPTETPEIEEPVTYSGLDDVPLPSVDPQPESDDQSIEPSATIPAIPAFQDLVGDEDTDKTILDTAALASQDTMPMSVSEELPKLDLTETQRICARCGQTTAIEEEACNSCDYTDASLGVLNSIVAGDTQQTSRLLNAKPAIIHTITGKHAWTLLHMASSGGNARLVDLLLRHGSQVNAQNIFGKTALHYAALKGHVQIVGLLLDNNADLSILFKGKSALQHASENDQHQVVELLKSKGS